MSCWACHKRHAVRRVPHILISHVPKDHFMWLAHICKSCHTFLSRCFLLHPSVVQRTLRAHDQFQPSVIQRLHMMERSLKFVFPRHFNPILPLPLPPFQPKKTGRIAKKAPAKQVKQPKQVKQLKQVKRHRKSKRRRKPPTWKADGVIESRAALPAPAPTQPPPIMIHVSAAPPLPPLVLEEFEEPDEPKEPKEPEEPEEPAVSTFALSVDLFTELPATWFHGPNMNTRASMLASDILWLETKRARKKGSIDQAELCSELRTDILSRFAQFS